MHIYKNALILWIFAVWALTVYVWVFSHSVMSHPLQPSEFSPPGSSVHEILQARILEQVAICLLQRIFSTQGSNSHLLCLLHCRWMLYHWATGKPLPEGQGSQKLKTQDLVEPIQNRNMCSPGWRPRTMLGSHILTTVFSSGGLRSPFGSCRIQNAEGKTQAET